MSNEYEFMFERRSDYLDMYSRLVHARQKKIIPDLDLTTATFEFDEEVEEVLTDYPRFTLPEVVILQLGALYTLGDASSKDRIHALRQHMLGLKIFGDYSEAYDRSNENRMNDTYNLAKQQKFSSILQLIDDEYKVKFVTQKIKSEQLKPSISKIKSEEWDVRRHISRLDDIQSDLYPERELSVFGQTIVEIDYTLHQKSRPQGPSIEELLKKFKK